MRLRIQTFSPLPELKAWFIPEIQDPHDTVFDLKELLCKDVPQLRTSHIHAQSLILLLEGFELLNDSPISAVRDGDLITVKMAQRMNIPSQSRKRKRNSSEFDISPKKTSSSRGAATHQASSTHQNVSQSSESEQSNSDSESTTSDSSSSASSSDSPPTKLPAKNVLDPSQLEKHLLARGPPKQPSKTTHIPPGQGKPSTHSRNKRRRKKREHEKTAKAGLLTQPKGISEVNNLPNDLTRTENTIDSSSTIQPQSLFSNEAAIASLPAHDVTPILHENDRGLSSKYVHITPDQVMMGSLRNKNKKKGFKQAMTGPIHRKIIFSGGVGQEQPNESNRLLDDHASQNLGDQQFSEANRAFHRLVPPSELQDLGQLPPNVFVTSVDVEKHIWGSKNGPPKKNKRKSMCGYDDGGDGFEEYRVQEGGDEGYGEDLPYDEGAQAGEQTSLASDGVDWDKAEKLWEASSPIQDIQKLANGVVFGWKELAINPQTFTPEILLSLASVTTNVGDGIIIFHRLRRPGASEAAVAFGVAAGGSDGVEDGGDMEEECASWSDVLELRWRLVDI